MLIFKKETSFIGQIHDHIEYNMQWNVPCPSCGQAAGVAAPFQGLVFGIGGPSQDLYWILEGNQTCYFCSKGVWSYCNTIQLNYLVTVWATLSLLLLMVQIKSFSCFVQFYTASIANGDLIGLLVFITEYSMIEMKFTLIWLKLNWFPLIPQYGSILTSLGIIFKYIKLKCESFNAQHLC